MSLFFLILMCSMVGAWGIAAWVSKHAERFKLIQPVSSRSSHMHPTPQGGGLGIVVISTVIGMGFVEETLPSLNVTFGLALLIALLGLIDDIYHLSAWVRFFIQTGTTVILLLLLGQLPPLDLILSGSLEEGILFHGSSLFVLLLLTGIWWINLFNFMDGIDGIASIQALSMLVLGAGLAVWAQPELSTTPVYDHPVWRLMLYIAAATGGFLYLNWSPAKIFMGDIGSTWLAFIIFALALFSIQAGWLNYATWLVLAAVFVTDATITLCTRIGRGECFYEAHRDHLFQQMSRRIEKRCLLHAMASVKARAKAHQQVCLGVVFINLLWIGPLAWMTSAWPEWQWVITICAYAPLIIANIMVQSIRPREESL